MNMKTYEQIQETERKLSLLKDLQQLESDYIKTDLKGYSIRSIELIGYYQGAPSKKIECLDLLAIPQTLINEINNMISDAIRDIKNKLEKENPSEEGRVNRE